MQVTMQMVDSLVEVNERALDVGQIEPFQRFVSGMKSNGCRPIVIYNGIMLYMIEVMNGRTPPRS